MRESRDAMLAEGRAMAEQAAAGVAGEATLRVLARLAGALRGGATLGQAAGVARITIWTAAGVVSVVRREQRGGRPGRALSPSRSGHACPSRCLE